MKVVKNCKTQWLALGILGIVHFSSSASAGDKQNFYIGGGAGVMTLNVAGIKTSSGLGYGAFAGYHFTGPFGVGAYYQDAPLTNGGTYSRFGGQLDFYPGGGNTFYLGPRIGQQAFS